MSQAPKYTPNPVPDNPEDLPQYLLQEFQKIQAALEENPTTFIEVKNVAPSRIKQGDIVYADGSNFNPGSAEGIYFRNAAGSILGDSRILLRYLINESGSELGKRFYLGTGIVIPGNSVLTSDPFFLDGQLYKSHRHFSLSSGAYKGIIESQLFLKRN